MAKYQFVRWLLEWLRHRRRFDFEWDRGNEGKSFAKHLVTKKEIEEVFWSRTAIALGVQIGPRTAEPRFGLLGRARGGRLLHVAFTLRRGRVRPISARPANRRERRFYEASICQAP